MSEFSRETLLNIIETDHVQCGEASALARMALAAMDSEPVEMPLDYLQGHKDGLEWAAQLAEANHPETGDWLYDDPIELAKAIRKGPDMQPAQPVEDSEPDRNPVLAYADSYRDMAKQGVESVPIWSVITNIERNIAPLYRHAQPAAGNLSRIFSESYQVIGALAEALNIFNELPVIKALDNLSAQELIHDDVLPFSVPEDSKPAQLVLKDHQIRELVNQLRDIAIEYNGAQQLRERIARVLRAAMLQAGTLINEGTTQTGNSLAIPDGWTGNDKANAALMMLDRIETADPVDDDRIDGIKRIVRELVAATQPQNAPQNIPEIIPGWIPVSERMPEMGEKQRYVLAADFKNNYWPNIPNTQVGVYGDWFDDGNPTWDDGDGEDLHLKEVTHWMPLPAAPQEDINTLIPLVSRNEQEGK
ncbi:DUF551 domain-containing protein [Klebsiella quasipneumoniae]|uniref:DUF551 domain-containing protein n=1 Tax=Klebsiella quasipneumoniae TaxID=1463165 RepID=UPI001F555D73|nr:DUF551 domain-containing protein [Klebsiella quasipneumoniae]